MGNVIETLNSDGRFNTFVSAIEAANLAGTLAGPGPFTVFAPTDEAFAGLPDDTVDNIMADIPALTRLLLYHIVPGRVTARDLQPPETVMTMAGDEVQIQRLDSKYFASDAWITSADIIADNGVIHVVDAVLLPPAELR